MRCIILILVLSVTGCAGYRLVPAAPGAPFLSTGTVVNSSPVPGVPPGSQNQSGAPNSPTGNGGALGEHLAGLSQKIASIEDDKKALAMHVYQLENQLRDKDKALTQAHFEIREATTQITKTREDLQRWQQEVDGLRVKLRTAERESKVTLEAVVHTLEQALDKESMERAK